MNHSNVGATNKTLTSEKVDTDGYKTGDGVGAGISGAQVQGLKTKVHTLQDKFDQLLSEYSKKDDEKAQLLAKIKDLEEDRARLRKTTNGQQTQIEKHRALAEASTKKCEGLQLQVSALKKEIQDLDEAQEQAAANQGALELRLNRALEEVERTKTQLSKMKQIHQDKLSSEQQSKEIVLTENKVLKKQKAELIIGFKKQLKLIDVLKKLKMHVEASRLLSFTEEEFKKALNKGKS
ncbi:testis-expressed protein 9-like [Cynoglossus semilaevis]|uniref:testis-expressed protein 9-like n=1 Tax=Cynoglossus semilaevis TaxID=244447 RepID=UPI0004982C1F|nr:testis-expressed protein 9-like [Cynoglossus semilaevis]